MSKNVKIIAGIVGVLILLAIVYMLYSKSKAPAAASGTKPAASSSSTVGNITSLITSAFGFGTSIANTQAGSANSSTNTTASGNGAPVNGAGFSIDGGIGSGGMVHDGAGNIVGQDGQDGVGYYPTGSYTEVNYSSIGLL
jgi:uncharacterized membrane protein YfcA